MPGAKPPLLVRGMHGMGDNIHQRAVIRQLMTAHDVWLETSWVSIYHDLIDQGLKVIRKASALRTQNKNAHREAALFSNSRPPQGAPVKQISYRGIPLENMCRATGTDLVTADFRLPIRPEWLPAAQAIWSINGSGKPLMIYRPLVARREWRGGELRNADPAAYAELLAEIRDQFYVVSIADLDPAVEYIIGPTFKADAEFHKGELPFETLAALFYLADLVFTSSGFAAVLAPAVGTPVISILGGYETAAFHATGAKFAPYLGIDTINPCSCQIQTCGRGCSKAIDLIAAKDKIRKFVSENCSNVRTDVARTPMTEMFGPPMRPVISSPQQAALLMAQNRQSLRGRLA